MSYMSFKTDEYVGRVIEEMNQYYWEVFEKNEPRAAGYSNNEDDAWREVFDVMNGRMKGEMV